MDHMQRQPRPLTHAEARTINLLNYFDKLISERRLSGQFKLTGEAFAVFEATKLAQPLRVTRNRKDDTYDVRIELVELDRYIRSVCAQVGITIELDGNVTTRDGFVIKRNTTL